MGNKSNSNNNSSKMDESPKGSYDFLQDQDSNIDLIGEDMQKFTLNVRKKNNTEKQISFDSNPLSNNQSNSEEDPDHEGHKNKHRKYEGEHEDFGDFSVMIYKLILYSVQLMLVLVLTQTRDLIIFPFLSKTSQLHTAEALSTVAIIYHIFFVTVPISITQGYSYKAAEAYSAKNYYHLGLLTNKIYFKMLILSMVFSLLMIFFFGPYFSVIIVNKQTVSTLTIMFLWLSVGIFFSYLQVGSMRYLNAIDKVHISLLGSITGAVCQLIFLFLYYSWGEIGGFVVSMSININCVSTCMIQLGYSIIWDPLPEANVPFTEGLFDDMSSFVSYSIIVGSVMFVPMFTFDLHPYLGLFIDNSNFTILNFICILLLALYVVCSGISAGNNILINYLIGSRSYDRILSLFFNSLVIVGVYTTIIGLILGFHYIDIIHIFTTKAQYVHLLEGQKIWFIISFILMNFHCLLSETISTLGGEAFSFLTLLIGRILVSFILAVILIVCFDAKVTAVLLSFVIGQSITIICNIWYFVYLFKDGSDGLKKKIMEKKYEMN